MQAKYAIIALVAIGFVATTQAAVKDIPPYYRESPNARLIDENTRADVDFRLPNNTEPLEYNIKLTTNIHEGKLPFDGIVEIKFNVVNDTKSIVLHARQLTINKASVKEVTAAATEAKEMTWSYESEREFLTLTPRDTALTMLQDSNWILTIEYNGTLRTDNGGFYVSTYLDENKATRYLATTQFESTDARHAFPCYDEPAKRAKFTITIDHHESYAAVSNMPIKTTTKTGTRNTTVFETTPSMPSYLVAFIISDFAHIEGHLNSLPQSVYSRPGTEHTQEFALVSGILILASLAEYYKIPFALPKMDQFAIPDFAAGAMENYGIVTYREEYLLFDKKLSTISTQFNIANIIAHEFAHQWFGNYVAIQWWTYLWLKEGFATMFSYKGTDDAYPDWGVMQFFHTDDYQRALASDSGNTTRPMTHYVQKPNEISRLYDSISYSKAGSVLFMWQYALTDEVFQQGLHNYLNDNQFSAATEEKLFLGIQNAQKELGYPIPAEIQHMMGSWTNQGGYPLLTVKRHYNGSFTVTQEAYHSDKRMKSDKKWYVPFNYAKQSAADFRKTEATHYLLNVSSILVSDSKLSDSDWLILNKQSTGYYRIMYDERNWKLIIDALLHKPHKIDPRNRAQLLHDMYNFISSDRLPHEHLMNMMTYLPKEDQYAPWSTANSILTTFNRYLSGDKEYSNFQFFVSMLANDLYDYLGVNDVPGEHRNNKYLRSIAINLNCLAGNADCLKDTNDKLKGQIYEGNPIEPNLQSQTYCNGLRQSGNAEFDYILDLLMKSDDQAKRRILISSLGCSQEPTQIRNFLQYSINDNANNTLRVQERTTLLGSAYSRGDVGIMASIEFLDENWEPYSQLNNGGFSNSNPLDDAIRGISSYVTNKEQESKLLALVAKVKDTPNMTSNLETVVTSNIKSNFDWLASNRDPLMNWIFDYRKSGSASLTASVVSIGVTISMLVMRWL